MNAAIRVEHRAPASARRPLAALAIVATLAVWAAPATPAPVLDGMVIIQGLNAPIPRQVARVDPQSFPPGQGVSLSGFGDAPAVGPESFGGAGVRAQASAVPGPGLLKAVAFARVDAFGQGRLSTGATAEADVRFELHDLIFRGPAASSVAGVLFLDLDGGFNLIARQIAQTGSALGSYALTINTSFGRGFAARTFQRFADDTETDTIGDSGALEGYLGGDARLEFPFLVPANQRIDLFVNMQLIATAGFSTNGPDFFGAAESLAAFLNTLSFPTDGAVFLLPDGFTAESPDGRIVDNRWLGPETPAVTASVPPSLALLAAGIVAARLAHRRGPGRAARRT